MSSIARLFGMTAPGQGSPAPMTYVDPNASVTDTTGTRTWAEYLSGLATESPEHKTRIGGSRRKTGRSRRGRGRGRATRRR